MTTHPRTALGACLVSLALGGCVQETVLVEATGREIGPAGGELMSADGNVLLTVGEGALDQAVAIGIRVDRDASMNGLRSPIYHLTPDGLEFATPVTLAFEVGDQQDLVLAWADPARPVMVSGSAVEDGRLSGRLEHFSGYGAFSSNAPCNTDSDCLMGQLCTQGTCGGPPQGGCMSDSDCAMGERCDPATATCSPVQSSNVCMTYQDCSPGQQCVQGVCVGTPSGCQSDADCAMGETCDPMTGTCVGNTPTGCQSDADCAMGETCDPMTGTCSPAQAACMSYLDCAQGQQCVQGACVGNTVPCQSDADCGPGYACDPMSAVCVSAPSGCQSDADCAMGETCDPMTGTCVGNTPTGCQSDADCAMGETCDPMTGTCSPAQAACMSYLDCAQGQQCVQGACVGNTVACQSDADCGPGYACDPMTSTCR